MTERTMRKDVPHYDPSAGEAILDSIRHVIALSLETKAPINLIFNDRHIVVFPWSTKNDILDELDRLAAAETAHRMKPVMIHRRSVL